MPVSCVGWEKHPPNLVFALHRDHMGSRLSRGPRNPAGQTDPKISPATNKPRTQFSFFCEIIPLGRAHCAELPPTLLSLGVFRSPMTGMRIIHPDGTRQRNLAWAIRSSCLVLVPSPARHRCESSSCFAETAVPLSHRSNAGLVHSWALWRDIPEGRLMPAAMQCHPRPACLSVCLSVSVDHEAPGDHLACSGGCPPSSASSLYSHQDRWPSRRCIRTLRGRIDSVKKA